MMVERVMAGCTMSFCMLVYRNRLTPLLQFVLNLLYNLFPHCCAAVGKIVTGTSTQHIAQSVCSSRACCYDGHRHKELTHMLTHLDNWDKQMKPSDWKWQQKFLDLIQFTAYCDCFLFHGPTLPCKNSHHFSKFVDRQTELKHNL